MRQETIKYNKKEEGREKEGKDRGEEVKDWKIGRKRERIEKRKRETAALLLNILFTYH